MRDEKRQTRLLPFRLRRDARPDEFDADARDASAGTEEFADDAELSALLRTWDAPEPSADARARLLAEFKAGVVRVPLWRRALASEIRVPLPVAACAALALFASLFALVARTRTPTQVTMKSTPADVRTSDAPGVKIVELPVERERVVTRVVYVEKNAPRAEAQRLAATQQSMTTQQSTRRSTTTTSAALAQSNHEDARGVRTAIDSSAQPNAEPTSYFTRVNMADFQPAEKMELRLVRRGKTDEK
jgi:hypothetical protein